MLIYFFYCVFGAVSYAILSRLMQHYYVANVFYVSNYSNLCLAKYMQEIYEKTMEASREEYRKIGKINEEEEKLLKKSDDKMMEDWKVIFIITMLNMYPPKLRKHLPFTNWREAMNWMEIMDKKYGATKL